jgi:hypothetical protein
MASAMKRTRLRAYPADNHSDRELATFLKTAPESLLPRAVLVRGDEGEILE